MGPTEVLDGLLTLAERVGEIEEQGLEDGYTIEQSGVLQEAAVEMAGSIQGLNDWAKTGLLPKGWVQKFQYWISFYDEDNAEGGATYGPFDDNPVVVDNYLVAKMYDPGRIIARYNQTPPDPLPQGDHWEDHRGWFIDKHYGDSNGPYYGFRVEARPKPALRKFLVKTREIHDVEYVVEATSAKDAQRKVLPGEAADAERSSELDEQIVGHVEEITELHEDPPTGMQEG